MLALLYSGKAAAETPDRAAALAASIAPTTAVSSVTGYPAHFCPRDAARRQARSLTPARNTATVGPEAASPTAGAPPPPAEFRRMSFRDGLIDRLAGTRKLSFVSLLKTGDSDVYLGVTRSGIVGLHVDMRNVLPTGSH